MRLFLILFLLYINLHSDSIVKTWQITAENDILTTEDDPFLYAANDVTVNIDDLPLAKTYPVDKPLPLKSDKTTQEKIPSNIRDSIDELKKSMNPKSVSELSENKNQIETLKAQQSDFEYYIKFLEDNPRLSLTLLSSLLALVLLFWFFSRGEKKEDNSPLEPERERFSKIMSEFLNLKGKIHEQFIIRKQNILFNNDFTQYQKAKALLELEKEYNDLEYFQIAKLLCSDFPQFVKAGEVLTSKPELRDIVSEYIEETMLYRDYTKEQKRILREKLKNFYNTGRHTWEYDEQALEINAKKEQTAYLLQ